MTGHFQTPKMIDSLYNAVFRCSHKRTSFPQRPATKPGEPPGDMYVVCLDCGKVEEFYDAEIEKRQNAVAKAKGFTIADHSLSIYANCTKDKCPNRNGAPVRHHHT